jgi:flagellar hook-associated protein 1 FlgK
MPSTFFGLSVAHSGLEAQRRAMDVVSYNIANANDPMYKRQRVVFSEGAVLAQATDSSPNGTSPFGSGVAMGDVIRIKDQLVENRLRQSLQSLSAWDYRTKVLQQLEATLGEPGDKGLQEDLDAFWASWQKVATSPDSLPIRSSLLENATALCQRLGFVYSQLINQSKDLGVAIEDRVAKINLMADEIGRLNNQISSMKAGRIAVNDLQNRRDALVQEMGKLVDVTQHGDGGSGFILSIGGTVLVEENKVNHLQAQTDATGVLRVQWVRDGAEVEISGGEMRAILDLRDTDIPDYMAQLDSLATELVNSVNTLHRAGRVMDGSAGGDFFLAGSTAGNLQLDPTLVGHPELIAASLSGAIGDGDVAQQIAALKETSLSGGKTVNQLYRDLIGDLAGASFTSQKQVAASKLVVDQFTTQQQAVSGVSIDEELTNMIKFQQAYSACARVITTMDQMLDALMQTGIVGR